MVGKCFAGRAVYPPVVDQKLGRLDGDRDLDIS